MEPVVEVAERSAGDQLSFSAFYEDSYGVSLRLGMLLVGDRERAAELVQDSFLAAHRRWDTVAGYDRPDLWLRRVMVNNAKSFRRRRSVEGHALSRAAGRRETHVDDQLLPETVWEVVRSLPARQATALTLVYGMDMSVAQAAVVMECAEGTVKTHLARGRDGLRSVLEGEQ